MRKRLWLVRCLCGVLAWGMGGALQVELNPAQAAPGDTVILTLGQQDRDGPLPVYVGSRVTEAIHVADTRWLFQVPDGGLPGPQPVRVAPRDRSAPADAWLDVVAASPSAVGATVAPGAPARRLQKPVLIAAPPSPLGAVPPATVVERLRTGLGQRLPLLSPDGQSRLRRDLNELRLLPYQPLPGVGRLSIPSAVSSPRTAGGSPRLQPTVLPRELLDRFSPVQRKLVEDLPAGRTLQVTLADGTVVRITRPVPGGSRTLSAQSGQIVYDRLEVQSRSVGFTLPGLPERLGAQVCGQTLYVLDPGALQVADVTDAALRAGLSADPTAYGYPTWTALPAPQPAATRAATEQALISTGVFREVSGQMIRQNSPQAGTGVEVFVIDTGGPGSLNGDDASFVRRDGRVVYGHGTVVGWLISRKEDGIAPGAFATTHHRDACTTNQSCDPVQVLRFLCEAAAVAATGKPVIINLSINTPNNSPLLYRALQDVTAAGALVVGAHGNRDRCDRRGPAPASVSTIVFADVCTAYPADWVGVPVAGVPQAGPPVGERNVDLRSRGVYTVGAWNWNRGKPADLNRAAATPALTPTLPTTYAPGEYYFDFETHRQQPYGGTSFAAPIVTGLLAEWLGSRLSARTEGQPTAPQRPDMSRLSTPFTWPQLTSLPPAP